MLLHRRVRHILSERFNSAHSELRGFEDLTEIRFGRIKKQIV